MRQEQRPQKERDEQQNYEDKLRYFIGSICSDLLWFFLDITFVWPDNRKEALWLGIVYGGARLVEIRWLNLRVTGVIVTLVVIAGIISQPYLPPVETPNHGWLSPGNEPAPTDNACANPPTPEIRKYIESGLTLLVGDSGVILTKANGKTVVFSDCGHDLLWITSEGGKLYVSANIWDGKIMAQIENNEFTLNPNNYFKKERPDSHTLAVEDQMTFERLRVKFLNPHAVVVTGIFGYPTCGTAVATAKGIVITPLEGPKWFVNRDCAVDLTVFLPFK